MSTQLVDQFVIRSDEARKLRAENAQLRALLTEIVEMMDMVYDVSRDHHGTEETPWNGAFLHMERARKLLGEASEG